MLGEQVPLNTLLVGLKTDFSVTPRPHHTSLNTVKQQCREVSFCIELYKFRLNSGVSRARKKNYTYHNQNKNNI